MSNSGRIGVAILLSVAIALWLASLYVLLFVPKTTPLFQLLPS
jgi:hypothetical protein